MHHGSGKIPDSSSMYPQSQQRYHFLGRDTPLLRLMRDFKPSNQISTIQHNYQRSCPLVRSSFIRYMFARFRSTIIGTMTQTTPPYQTLADKLFHAIRFGPPRVQLRHPTTAGKGPQPPVSDNSRGFMLWYEMDTNSIKHDSYPSSPTFHITLSTILHYSLRQFEGLLWSISAFI